MVVPPSKKKKFSSEDELKVLQKTVRQALLSDDKSCEVLLGKLVGFEKEIVDALVIILRTCNVFQFSPTSPVLRVVCQNFASIGATTAIGRFHEFHNLILTNADNEYTSNFAFLMEKLISSSHVLRHDKLRHELCNHLPITIALLWQNKKHVEACRIAKMFVELLLVAKLYHDEENLSALWLEKIASVGMMKCPYISALTILLDPQRSICGKGLIGLTDLLELPSNEIRDLCLRSQAADLFLTFLPSYYTSCTREELQAILEFLVSEHIRTDKLSSLMREINQATDCLTEVDTLWNSILKVLSQHLSEVLSRKDSHKSPLLNALASALQNLSAAEQCSDSSFTTISAPIRLVFKQGAEQKPTRKRKLGHDFKAIASVLCNLPLEALATSLSKHYTVAVLLLAIASESTELPLFSFAIRALQSLTKQPEERLLLRQVLFMDGIFLDLWFSNETEYSPTLCKDVIRFLSDVFEVESNGRICCDNTRDLCPALKYFGGEVAACWSWKQLMRFSILFSTTRWEELLQSSDSLQNHVIQEIRSIYLVNMVSSITWKDEELLKASAGRWSVLLTCWEAIPRGSRQPLIAKLLGSDLKVIGKFADRIIRRKLQLDKSIVEQALLFHLKYFSTSDKAQPLENIIDWDVLFYLEKMGASLDIVIPQLSVEKIVEMLQLCSAEDVLNEDALAIVGRMISLRLKERCNDVIVCLTSIFEKAKLSSQLLDCAAIALKVFARTDIERDIVVLCLSLLSSHDVTGADFEQLRDIQAVLYSAIQYAPSTTNNDQCAVFGQAFVKMLKAVQHFVHNKCGTTDEIDKLVHGANRLSHLLAQHKLYYSRVVGCILSQVIGHYDSNQVSIFKLHSINDVHSSSMMATSLPPAERLQYKRIFKMLKTTSKQII